MVDSVCVAIAAKYSMSRVNRATEKSETRGFIKISVDSELGVEDKVAKELGVWAHQSIGCNSHISNCVKFEEAFREDKGLR